MSEGPSPALYTPALFIECLGRAYIGTLNRSIIALSSIASTKGEAPWTPKPHCSKMIGAKSEPDKHLVFSLF